MNKDKFLPKETVRRLQHDYKAILKVPVYVISKIREYFAAMSQQLLYLYIRGRPLLTALQIPLR